MKEEYQKLTGLRFEEEYVEEYTNMEWRERNGYNARVVFGCNSGAVSIDGVDYAPNMSHAAHHWGYTPIPLSDGDHSGSAALLKADSASEEDGSGLTSWKLQVPSHFPQRRQPYRNNAHWYTKYDVVLQPNACAFSRGFMPG